MTDYLTEFGNLKYGSFEILNNLPIATYVTDHNGKTLFVNEAYSSITGIHLHEVVGRTPKEIEQESKLFIGSITDEIIRRKEKICSVAVLKKSDSNNIPAITLGTPVFDDNGDLKYAVTVILNRTVPHGFTFLPQSALYSGETMFAEQYGISPRELSLIDLLFEGFTYEEAADKLFISINTVRTHMRNIYRKTDTQNMGTLLQLYKDFKCFTLISFSLDSLEDD